MGLSKRRNELMPRILSCVLSATMVLSLMPAPALAEMAADDEGLEILDTPDVSQGDQVLMVTDDTAAVAADAENDALADAPAKTPTNVEVTADADNDAVADAPAKASTSVEVAADDSADEAKAEGEDEAGSGEQASDSQASETDGDADLRLSAASGLRAIDDVQYIERTWDANAHKVTSESKPATDAKPVPSDGSMTSGWYYLNSNVKVNGRIYLEGDTHLILCDGYTLDVKGIYVPKGSTFTIYGQSDGKDAGKIDSHPSSGAGIGATSDNHPGGNVVIHGGNIKAKGYDHCAGIGGNDGNEKDIGDFTMYGGTVNAEGGSYSAGIGGGQACEGGRITIYGGTVTAEGDTCGAGIGGGNGKDHDPFRGGHAGTITIWGGIVTAEGGDEAAGIGGGEGGNAGNITINGGTIIATGGKHGAGIGCGEGETTGTGGTITINGGTVTATGGDYAAGIGGGYNSCEDYNDQHGYCDKITINGGTIVANGGCTAAAIGAGAWTDSGNINISGGKITANPNSDNGIGIGSAHNSWGSTWVYFSYKDETRDTIEIMPTNYYAHIYFWQAFMSPYTGESFGTGELLDKDFIKDKRLVAYRWTSTTYREADGTEKTTEGFPVREDSYTWRGRNSTYIVDRDVNLDHQVEIRDNTTLILNDGCTLNLRNIKVEKKYTLTIYGQDKGTGTVITAPDNYNRSGIGGAYTDCGTININGGTVIATGGSDPSIGLGSAGIGAAYDQPAGTVNINGGTVVATGGAGAQGIGSSNKAKGKTNLSYTDYTCDKMSVTASSYDGTVKLAKPFMDKDDHTVFPAADSVSDLNSLAGRTLVPVVSKPTFRRANLLLSGSIGVNFLMELPEMEGVDYSKSYMEFTVSGKGGTTTTDAFDPNDTSKDGTLYAFTCNISSIQMADTITATFHYQVDEEEKTVSKEYSVAQYVADFDATGGFDNETVALVHAVADYGHYVQPFLSATRGWTIGTDYAEMPASTDYSESTIDDACTFATDYTFASDYPKGKGIDRLTAALMLSSDTSLEARVYTVDGEGIASATLADGTPLDVQKVNSSCWVVTVPSIKAQQLCDDYEVTFTTDGGTEGKVTMSGIAYANAVFRSDAYKDDQDALKAMTSLVRYHQAAKAYVEHNGVG